MSDSAYSRSARTGLHLAWDHRDQRLHRWEENGHQGFVNVLLDETAAAGRAVRCDNTRHLAAVVRIAVDTVHANGRTTGQKYRRPRMGRVLVVSAVSHTHVLKFCY